MCDIRDLKKVSDAVRAERARAFWRGVDMLCAEYGIDTDTELASYIPKVHNTDIGKWRRLKKPQGPRTWARIADGLSKKLKRIVTVAELMAPPKDAQPRPNVRAEDPALIKTLRMALDNCMSDNADLRGENKRLADEIDRLTRKPKIV